MYNLRVFSKASTPAPSLWAGVSLYFFIKKNIHFSSFSIPHTFFVIDVVLCLYGLNIVHLELQHVLVANGVDDGVGMERTRGLALLVASLADVGATTERAVNEFVHF